MITPKIKFNLGARTCIWAPKGRCIAGIDFTGQELMAITQQCKDPIMWQVYTSPETLIDSVTGKEYPNPDADMHTLSAKAWFPDIFKEPEFLDSAQQTPNPNFGQDYPKSQWLKIAKDDTLIKLPGSPRDYGKILAAA